MVAKSAMTQPFRLASGGLIDRTRPKSFLFDGRTYVGFAGDTLGSALLAHGVRVTGQSLRFGRPRGIMTEKDPVQPLGNEAGALAPEASASSAVAPPSEVTCDVAVIGAGAAGLFAARAAASMGARVVIVEQEARAGGWMLNELRSISSEPAATWMEKLAAEILALNGVISLLGTKAVALDREGGVLALKAKGKKGAMALHLHANHVIWAGGAKELPLPFEDNDRPGIMLSSAARCFVNRFAVLPGHAVLVATNNDTGYLTAFDLYDRGGTVVAIVDERPATPSFISDLAGARNIAVIANAEVRKVHYAGAVEGVDVVEKGRDHRMSLPCDSVLMSGGLHPPPPPLAADLEPPDPEAAPHLTLAGSAAGAYAFRAAVSSGAKAGTEAAMGAGFVARQSFVAPRADRLLNTQRVVGSRKPLAGDPARIFADFDLDVTEKDLSEAAATPGEAGAGAKAALADRRLDALQRTRPSASIQSFYGAIALGLISPSSES